MVTVGLYVRLTAKAGKEKDLERFLASAAALVADEPETIAWFALRFAPLEFGLFDVFPNDAARRAHLAGRVAAALAAGAGDLLTTAPRIEPVDVLAATLPGDRQQGA